MVSHELFCRDTVRIHSRGTVDTARSIYARITKEKSSLLEWLQKQAEATVRSQEAAAAAWEDQHDILRGHREKYSDHIDVSLGSVSVWDNEVHTTL